MISLSYLLSFLTRRAAPGWAALAILGGVFGGSTGWSRIPAFWDFSAVTPTEIPESFFRDDLTANPGHGPLAVGVHRPDGASQALEFHHFRRQYLRLGDTPFLDGETGFSAAFWVYPRMGQEASLLGKGPQYEQFGVYVEGGKLKFKVGAFMVETPAPNLGEWTHVAVVCAPDRLTVFYDGVEQVEGVFTGPVPIHGGPLLVGVKDPSTPIVQRYFDGFLDDLYIAPGVLTGEDILGLRERGPFYHWDFDEGSGTQAQNATEVAEWTGELQTGAVFTGTNPKDGRSCIQLPNGGMGQVEMPPLAEVVAGAPFTLGLWIYPDNWPAAGTVFSGGAGASLVRLARNGSGLRLEMGAQTVSGPLPATATWTHVGVTYDGEEARLWINGVEEGAVAVADLAPPAGAFLLGNDASGGGDPSRYFFGCLDEWVVLPAALVAAEMATLAGLDAGGFVNSAPVAEDAAVSTYEEQPVTFTPPAEDADRDDLHFEVVSPPANGSVELSGGQFTFTPDDSFLGQTTFDFVAMDGWSTSAPATVTIQVDPVPIPATVSPQSVTLNEDEVKVITLVGEDPDSPLVWTIETDPAHGTLELNFPQVTYTPDPDFHGTDSFVFSLNDSGPATVSLTIVYVNDAPAGVTHDAFVGTVAGAIEVDILANDGVTEPLATEIILVDEADFGDAVITDGKIVYTPGPGYTFGDLIRYKLRVRGDDSPVARVSVRPADIFPVTHFGAAGDGVVDDTDVIQSTLDLAGAYAQVNGAATVMIPNGTYLMTTRGTMEGSLLRKEAGVWVNLGTLTNGAVRGIWTCGISAPNNANGVEGDRYVNLKDGKLYEKTGGVWVAESVIIVDGAGDGWISGFDAPTGGTGNNGDYYFDYHVKFGNYGQPCLTLTVQHNGVTFQGESRENAILTMRSWGGVDPMDYEVVKPKPPITDDLTTGVVSTRLPRDSSGFYVRGMAIVFAISKGFPAFQNITLRDFTLLGNTTFNGKHGWHTNYDRLEEWDITHKGIAFTFGGPAMNDVVVDNCTLDGFRGETLYRGGDGNAEILIKNSTIRKSNSSAISISGLVTVENCLIEDIYNGFENYAVFPGQYTIVRDSTIRRATQYGIVYIGQVDDTTFLEATGNTIESCGFAAIFLSEFAFDCLIENNTINDCYVGVYAIYLNQYGIAPLGFKDITVRNNLYTMKTVKNGNFVGAFLGAYPCQNWLIENNTLVTEGTGTLEALVDAQHPGPRHFRSGFIVQNNFLASGRPTLGPHTGSRLVVRPLFFNNTYGTLVPGITNADANLANPFMIYPRHDVVRITSVAVDGKVLTIGDIGWYLDGFLVNISSTHASNGVELKPDPAWNTFTRGYMLYPGAAITLVYSESNDRFAVQSYTPRTGTPSTITTGTLMAFKGFETITLNPAGTTLYDNFSGVPENVPVTITYNANSQFADNAVIDTPTGTDWAPGVAGTVNAIKQNGVLVLEIP